jgi:hypothetical protein
MSCICIFVHSPTKYTVEHMASMTRRLVGETYADALGIPPGETALLKRLGVEARLLTFRLSSFLAALPLLGPRLTRFMHWALKSLMLKSECIRPARVAMPCRVAL